MAAPVWSRFTKVRDGKEIKFRIQEINKDGDQFKQIIDMTMDYYVPEEPIHICSNLHNGKVDAIEEYKEGLTRFAKDMEYQIDACYIDDDSKESQIVGVSITALEKKGDKPFDMTEVKKNLKSEELKTFLLVSEVLMDICNVMKKYKLDSYYNDLQLFVHPDYRGIGLAGEILKAREILCKERGVQMTGAWMTSIGTQKAASKLGWETIAEIDYMDLGQKTGVSFEGIKDLPFSCKLMVKKV